MAGIIQALFAVVTSSADFNIFPAFSGKTSWNLATDGPLNIGTMGAYNITMLKTVTVTVKMWGAGGAPGGSYSSAYPPTTSIGPGGGGGYSTKSITLSSGTTYALYIGQGGRRNVIANLRTTGATYLSGGVQANSTNWGAEGGGLSGIFTGSSAFTQGSALLLAGGGGGGSDSGFASSGGAGGGASGQTPAGGAQSGGGGTASAGGVASAYNAATAGSALTGGLAQNSQGSLGGGGGGYYGGGGGNVGGGGGGSGYAPSGTTTTGSDATPANSADANRGGSGQGGSGSTNGTDGRVYISI